MIIWDKNLKKYQRRDTFGRPGKHMGEYIFGRPGKYMGEYTFGKPGKYMGEYTFGKPGKRMSGEQSDEKYDNVHGNTCRYIGNHIDTNINRRAQKWNRKIMQCLVLVMLLLCTLLSGCKESGEVTVQEEVAKEEKIQIGMSFDSFVIERWLRDRDLFVATAQNLGAEVNVQVANGNCEEQISQIEYFIKKGVDVIVVIAVDGEKLHDVVTRAKKEGIRVISYDRLIPNCNTDLYISFDNKMVGTLMGQEMVRSLPDGGKIMMINGSPLDKNVDFVSKGFLNAIKNSGLDVVYTSYCDNWLAELAYDAVEEGLQQNNRNIAGVMCGNDDLAGQAAKALSENRLSGKVVLVGQDAELAACQRIVEGVQTMTVYKKVENLADQAARFACALGYERRERELTAMPEEKKAQLKAIRTEMRQLEAIDDGTYLIPYHAIEPIAVTRDNIDEIIIGGDFHTEEDVYLNVNRK